MAGRGSGGRSVRGWIVPPSTAGNDSDSCCSMITRYDRTIRSIVRGSLSRMTISLAQTSALNDSFGRQSSADLTANPYFVHVEYVQVDDIASTGYSIGCLFACSLATNYRKVVVGSCLDKMYRQTGMRLPPVVRIHQRRAYAKSAGDSTIDKAVDRLVGAVSPKKSPRAEGTIASVFASLSGEKAVALPARFAALKR